MKLGLGQILTRKDDRSRWQVVLIETAQIKLRRVVLTDAGGPQMVWMAPMSADENDFASAHRAHVEILYEQNT